MIEPEERIVMLNLQIAFCSLSILGSLLIIFFYFNLKQKHKSFSFLLIFNIALTDLLLWGIRLAESIHGRISGHTFNEFPGFCQISAYVQVTLALSNFCWVGLVSFCIYQTLIHRIESFEHYQRRFYFFSYGFPIAYSLIPFITKSYGKTDGITCSIKGTSEELGHSLVRLIVFYLPLLLSISYSFWVIIKVWNVLRIPKQSNFSISETEQRDKLVVRIRNQMMFYPMALVASYFFPLIHRFISTTNVTRGDQLYILILHYISEPLQGFFNSLVYGATNRDVKNYLKKQLGCLCLAETSISESNRRLLSEPIKNPSVVNSSDNL